MSQDDERFRKLIKPSGYQVFLFACPASLPCSFAVHPWFVCVKNGEVSRWEVRFELNHEHPELGKHLHLNSLPPFSGIEIIPFVRGKFLWKVKKLLGYLEGGEGSAAGETFNFIARSKDRYPHRNAYALWGPNSDTYVQWVLDHSPDFHVALPWNGFGKKYKVDSVL